MLWRIKRALTWLMHPLCGLSFELRWGLEDSLKKSQVGKDDVSLKRFPFFLPWAGMHVSSVTQWQWLPNFTTVLLSPHQLKTLMETTMVTTYIIFTSLVLHLLFHQPWPSYVDPHANQGLQHFPHRDRPCSGPYLLPQSYQKCSWPLLLLHKVAPSHWDCSGQSIRT